MITFIGDGAPDPEALTQMRERGGKWCAFQNHDLGHPEVGNLRFLQYGGTGSTFATPPDRYPDTQHGLGWRYLHCGFVDLATGTIVPTEPA